jgi:hypothetical protein
MGRVSLTQALCPVVCHFCLFERGIGLERYLLRVSSSYSVIVSHHSLLVCCVVCVALWQHHQLVK